MSSIPSIGIACLGIFIGWLVRYFLFRFKTFTPKTLGSVISIITGGAVFKIFGADKTILWFYPIGLLIGLILYTVIAFIGGGPDVPKEGIFFERKTEKRIDL